MKKLSSILFTLLSFLSSAAIADMPSSCDSFTTTMTQSAVAVFHDTSHNEQQKRQALAQLFQAAVDTDWIGKFVLGRFWNGANNEEQKQFLQQYRTYLTNIYISKFRDEDGLNVDDIKVEALMPQSGGEYQARTLIQNKGEDDVHVDYLLDQSAGKCQVHDIKIEGVSLLTTQRSEFQNLAASSGIKGIIDAMQKRHE